MAENVVVLMRSEKGQQLVLKKCKAASLDMGTLELLLEAEIKQVGKLKKHGLWNEFDEIFNVLDNEES